MTLLAVSLSGCATFPEDHRAEGTGRLPSIHVDQESGEAWMELSVLTYNVEGLPWPARRHRSPRLEEIGRQLSAMREAGVAPDIVLLQEVFTSDAGRNTTRSGYPTRVRGPGRRAERPPTSREADPALTGRRKLLKGERLGRLFSSGLYVLSEFPVVQASNQAFRRRECAGVDCLANKGMQHVTIQIPGVPQPLAVFNTHLNSARASRVRSERSLIAHRLQVADLARFIEEQREPGTPLILGGDFNMRGDDNRFAKYTEALPFTLVHQYCLLLSSDCAVGLSWDGDAPWMDTQDLQSFEDGSLVTIRPVAVDGMFDEPWNGAPLADHDGLVVRYRLSWSMAASKEVTGLSRRNGAPDA